MLARSSSCGSNPADVCPHLERTRPRGAVLAGGDVVAAEMEEVADLVVGGEEALCLDRKSTRLNSSHANISYAVFCLKRKEACYRLWRGGFYTTAACFTDTAPACIYA